MHLMLDFETLGNDFSTVVVSLGAVAFNRTGILSEKEWEFDFHEQIKAGRTVTASTLSWWMKQDDKARSVFQSTSKIKLAEFFTDFEKFIDDALGGQGEKRDELKVWGNGANFDVVIIEDVIRRHHPLGEFGIPWKFWNVWCYRTVNHLTKCKDTIRPDRKGAVRHRAVDDARFQAQTVLAYWKQQDMKRAKAQGVSSAEF